MCYPVVFANSTPCLENQSSVECLSKTPFLDITALLCFAFLSFIRECKAVQVIDGKLCLHCTQTACFFNERINLSNTDLFNESLYFIHSYNAFALVKLMHTFVRHANDLKE